MSSPLSTPEPWNDVAPGYDEYATEFFAKFAQHAYELLGLDEAQTALDVACGSGAVTQQMASAGHRVTAVDFSEQMLNRCRARLAAHKLEADTHLMDGQALSFEDGSFDAVSSMFGWMFFPDRAKGLEEFYRVLKPKGSLVVSSWAPIDESSLMRLVMGAVQEMALDPSPPQKPPSSLENAEVLATELFSAGFDDVQIIKSTQGFSVSDLDAFWHGAAESSAPLVMLKKRLGDKLWLDAVPKAKAYLRANCPNLPAVLSSAAWIAIARKPES